MTNVFDLLSLVVVLVVVIILAIVLTTSCYLQLDEEEVEARCRVLKDLEDAIHSKWSNSHVTLQPFGSFPAGLSTFLSDIDVSIISARSDDIDVEEANDNDENDNDNDSGKRVKENREVVVISSDDNDDDEENDGIVTWAIDRNGINLTIDEHLEQEGRKNDGDNDRTRSMSCDEHISVGNGVESVDVVKTSRSMSCESQAMKESEENEDKHMNDCGGFDIHISNNDVVDLTSSDQYDEDDNSDPSTLRKRKRNRLIVNKTSNHSMVSTSPSRELQLSKLMTWSYL